ncbi:MAG: RNA polymerase subunit sigma-24 [Clostridiales bacterium]|nr:MAG: RNA polymerase subunit sigma-24 [Clostridiales bacterium]
MSSEGQLIKKAKNGDIKAFESLIIDYQIYCYNIALGMLRSEEDAKDVSQEALIKVFKKLTTFNESADFSTWLYRIVVNSCLDYIKKRDKLRLVESDGEIDKNSSSGRDSVAEQVLLNELSDIVNRNLKKLKYEQRLPIILYDYLGLSYDDVAETLQIPLGTVKSRLKRGREKLRRLVVKDPLFSYSILDGEEVL